MPGIALEIRRKCKVCGKVFIAKTLDSQFCCKRCGDVFRKRQLDAKKREETLSRIILQIPDAREYISVKEAVAIFGVERDTIYRLIRKGRIPAINLGTRLTRIKREDLEKLIPTRDTIKAEKTEEIGNSVYPPARRKLAEHGIGCSGTVGQIGERLRLSENKAIQDYSV